MIEQPPLVIGDASKIILIAGEVSKAAIPPASPQFLADPRAYIQFICELNGMTDPFQVAVVGGLAKVMIDDMGNGVKALADWYERAKLAHEPAASEARN